MTVLDSTPRDQYTATSGQTVFPYTFEIAAAGDIKVLQNGTLINQGAGAGEYAVSGVGVDTGGNVTLVTGATAGDVLTIYRDMAYERLTAYTNAGDFLAADVNNDFDRLWLALQQNGGDLDRVLIAPNTDPTSIDMTIPDKATRLGKYLKFNDTTGNPEAGSIAGAFTAAGMNHYNFTGDGATVNFTLGMEPGGENNTQVYIDGVYQQKDGYNVSGAVVQFSVAPPNLSTIEVMVIEVLPVGSTTASQVSFTQAGSTYGRNVQLKLQESVSVKDFGAVGDGVTDDTAAIQAAAAHARSVSGPLYAPAGFEFYITAAVDFTGIDFINFESNILVDTNISEIPVVIGGFAQTNTQSWKFRDVRDDGSTLVSGGSITRPVLRIYGSKCATIHIAGCQYVQMYADGNVSANGSNAYNQINLEIVYKFEISGVNGGWTNENSVWNGRLKELTIDGSNYGHNHNKFYDNTFEGSDVDIQFLGGAYHNFISGARFEGVTSSTGITFGSDTYNNVVEFSWSGVGNPRAGYSTEIPITDNGQNNIVRSNFSAASQKITICGINPDTGVLSDGSNWTSLGRNTPSFQVITSSDITPGLKLLSATSFDTVLATPLIPVSLGDVFGMDLVSSDSTWRRQIYVYDSNKKTITSKGGGGEYISATGTSFGLNDGKGRYATTANNSPESISRPMSVLRSEVAYIQVALVSYAASTFESADIYIYSDKMSGVLHNLGLSSMGSKMPALANAPTQGYVPVGTCIYDVSASAVTYCEYSHETNLDGAVASSGTSVTVLDVRNIANGDIVGILLDDGTTHWTTVSSLSGSTFTVAAIPSAAADLSRIVFNRWST